MSRSLSTLRGGTGDDGNVGGGKSGLEATDTRKPKGAEVTRGGDGDEGNVGDTKSGLEGEDTPSRETRGGTGDTGNVGGEKSGLEALQIGLAPGEGPVRLTIRQEVVLEIVSRAAGSTEGKHGESNGRGLEASPPAIKGADSRKIGDAQTDTLGGRP